MNCPKCGKQLPDGSVFCMFCGESTNDVTPFQQITEWEYRDFSLTWESKTTGWVQGYSDPDSKLYFWQNFQARIMPELQILLDRGWLPISEIGPAGVKLRYYDSLEDMHIAIKILLTIGTVGIVLPFFLFKFGGHKRSEMIGYHVKLRRPKNFKRLKGIP